MRRIPTPTHSVSDSLAACIGSMMPGPKKQALLSCTAYLVTAEANYLQHAALNTLFSVPQTNSINALVTNEDAKALYKSVFARNAAPRAIYDIIKTSAKNICPLCDQRNVAGLDHYLCQSTHSDFVITPANLVPACADCNKSKLAYQPSAAGEQLMHPYFDDFSDAQWLHASLEKLNPAGLAFFVLRPPAWSKEKADRAENHFRVFQLGPFFASNSGSELSDIRGLLKGLHERSGAQGVRLFLEEMAASLEANGKLNSWRYAAYCTWAASNDFCDGGFA